MNPESNDVNKMVADLRADLQPSTVETKAAAPKKSAAEIAKEAKEKARQKRSDVFGGLKKFMNDFGDGVETGLVALTSREVRNAYAEELKDKIDNKFNEAKKGARSLAREVGNKIEDSLNDVSDSITDGANAIDRNVRKAAREVGSGIESTLNGAVGLVGRGADLVGAGANEVSRAVGSIANETGNLARQVGGGLNTAANEASRFIDNSVNAVDSAVSVHQYTGTEVPMRKFLGGLSETYKQMGESDSGWKKVLAVANEVIDTVDDMAYDAVMSAAHLRLAAGEIRASVGQDRLNRADVANRLDRDAQKIRNGGLFNNKG